MLAQARRLPQGLQTRCANGSLQWIQLRESSGLLQNQRVVILGFGAIASRLLELLAPFEMKVIAMRRKPRGDEGIPTVTAENLQQALATADHVISILPDNPDSIHFFSSERLGWMARRRFYNIGGAQRLISRRSQISDPPSRAAWLDVTDPSHCRTIIPSGGHRIATSHRTPREVTGMNPKRWFIISWTTSTAF
jgi:hypothetical protein